MKNVRGKMSSESVGREVAVLHRHGKIYLDKEMAELGIGSGQLPFLNALYEEDGISQEILTKKINIDKATTTRAINRLVKTGFAERQVDAEDRRAYQVFLTEKARKLQPKVSEILGNWTDILLSDFTEKEKKELLKLLGKLSKNADAAHE